MSSIAYRRTFSSLALFGALLAACDATDVYHCEDDGCGAAGMAGAGDEGLPGESDSPSAAGATGATFDVRSDAMDRTQAVRLDPGADPGPTAPELPDPELPVSAPQQLSERKVDLLLMVDNSSSMHDKQALLARTASDFVRQLANPPCVDAAGQRHAAPSPTLACPEGTQREFLPVHDINVAVISSSLGDVGANAACADPERNDGAHLIGSLPRGEGHGSNAAGVIELRPGGDLDTFAGNLEGTIDAVGQGGCGWEMSLESWYRFAVDPAPYERLERVSCTGSDSGAANCVRPAVGEDGAVLVDTELLSQRAAFFRPESIVSIVMLSDENDCSLQVGNQTWVVANTIDPRPMFRGSSICETNPNDACCYSCPLGAPPGCAEDPICDGDAEAGVLPNRLPSDEDGVNLRCFEQKRRFGIDFLYPVQRYVNALSQREICPSALDLSLEGCSGQPVPNPLFADGRDPSSVFLSGIVGVPWQELASDVSADGQPLAEGELRFASPDELDAADWLRLVGSSSTSPPVPPSSPFMLESPEARASIAVPNPINGREYATARGSAAPDDLQYACIFPLATPRDCSNVLEPGASEVCDCSPGFNDSPLCEQDPGVSAPGTTQFFAKAYPGLRQLEVLRGHGANAALGSICARNVVDEARSDFGYRPAMAALLERMQAELPQPAAQ